MIQDLIRLRQYAETGDLFFAANIVPGNFFDRFSVFYGGFE